MPQKPNIAVLIDAENINHIESIQSLIDDLQEFGQIVVKRAIGDWDRTIGVVRDPFVDLGFELVHQPNLAPGSNLADVRLVIEAIELLHNRNFDVETYAVVSSDQDFLPLYDRLRELGKTVIVAGDAHSNFTRIDEHADVFIPIDNAVHKDIRHKFNQLTPRRTKRGGVKVARRRMDKNVRGEIRKLLIRSMSASIDEHGVVPADKLYQTMRKLEPGFSVKRLGYAKFDRLLGSYRDVVRVRGRRRAAKTIKLLLPTAGA